MSKTLIALVLALLAAMLVSVGLNIWDGIERRMGRIDVADLGSGPAPEGAACVYRRFGKTIVPVRNASGQYACAEAE